MMTMPHVVQNYVPTVCGYLTEKVCISVGTHDKEKVYNSVENQLQQERELNSTLSQSL